MLRSGQFLLGSIVLSVVILSSCSREESLSLKYSSFDQTLWPILETFEYEANKRGIDMDLDAMSIYGHVEEIDENGVAGSCHYSSQQPNKITIDKSYWERASNLGREFVLFHELGHCILNRGHRENQDHNGLCISLMQSGLGSCRLVYSDANRDLYLDELFHPENF